MAQLMLFSGNATLALSEHVSNYLAVPLGTASVGRFSDGEIAVEIVENVRGEDVFVLQSTCAPTNDNLMELVVLCDALRRASASRITAVVPYFGYARQDRRPRSARVPITAKVVADIMVGVGIDRVLTVDLHADQIQGFFDVAVDNIYATPVMLKDIQKNQPRNSVVVSPDIGGVVRARAMAKQLDADLAIVDKRRPQSNHTEVMNIIGEVEDRTCLIIDDIVDTAGTLCNAAKALKDEGAKTVVAYCTHPVLSGAALDNLKDSALDELVVTDSIPIPSDIMATKRVRIITIAELIGEAVRRVSNEESISAMFR